ncbi:MAG: two-component system response regulator OmpR [Betaproteobacteria bacterium]|nr:two-component system response regulator OmpR [Betaproteobacteria bacterium]
MTDSGVRILVVDDDRRLRDLLYQFLTDEGFSVQAAGDAAAMDLALAGAGIDLVVLDLMLPGEDGLSICRRLRAAGNRTPIIMLTARGDDTDRIVGLETGADDYLPKPFNPRELVARIHAVLRRGGNASLPGAPVETERPIGFGAFTLNLGGRRLSRGDEVINLTTGEFALLKALVTHAGTPLTRERLMELAKGRELGMLDRTIDVQVSRLRKLIEEDPSHPRHLQTVWGYGYVFVLG